MPRNNVEYEWLCEYTDANGDIHDHYTAKTYKELVDQSPDSDDMHPTAYMCKKVYVLVRDEGNDQDGLLDRCWAYVNDGVLSDCFQDAFNEDMPNMKVPQKYLKQVNG